MTKTPRHPAQPDHDSVTSAPASDLGKFRLSWLDFKVGFRMLARYPGLTVVGTVAIAVAMALGTIYFEAVNKWRNPRLPVREADRVVSIRHWDAKNAAPEAQLLHEFAIWREEVESVSDLGAATPFVRNLATDDGRIEPVQGADVTASAFRLMETPPLMGRVLSEQDERPGEPPVAVIGHSLWRSRFASDPAIVGRAVKLGTSQVTIVGVMPEGYAFPVNHRVWTPLRIGGLTIEPRTGPSVSVFGRLAPGASMEDAQAELSAIGARMAADHPETHEHLAPVVTHYGKPLIGGGETKMISTMLYAVNGIFLMLMAVVCANVATLVFARNATRGWEITVRSALGASRGRIIAQLFSEALVLAGVATLIGLILAGFALRRAVGLLEASGNIPFWIDASLSWKTVLYVALLTIFSAAIIGILPALRVTRKNVQEALRREGAARSGLRFGGLWTTVIVVQVAITVAFLPLAAGGAFESNRFNQRAEGIGAARYLTASVDVDREDHGIDDQAFASRARERLTELQRRLEGQPGVEQVAFADRLPVEDQFKYQIQLDSDPPAGPPENVVRTSTHVQVSDGFFEAFGTSLVAGRNFGPADFQNGGVLIVNESFARHVLGGRNPVGHRVRITVGEDMSLAGDEWYLIVGMVKDFGWQLPQPHEQSAMYRPVPPGPGNDFSLAVRVQDPEAFSARLRAIAAEVDPAIRLTKVQPLTDVGGGEATMNWTLTSVAWLISAIVLLLSSTGIHALMSFTVARRTREIGIRAALGAGPRRIAAQIFSRAFLQIGTGVLIGAGLAAMLGFQSPTELLLLLGAVAVMLVAGLIACAVPVRRALKVHPMEALRDEG